MQLDLWVKLVKEHLKFLGYKEKLILSAQLLERPWVELQVDLLQVLNKQLMF
jgi:hypothetical protein